MLKIDLFSSCVRRQGRCCTGVTALCGEFEKINRLWYIKPRWLCSSFEENEKAKFAQHLVPEPGKWSTVG
jgi:hypothetical protein